MKSWRLAIVLAIVIAVSNALPVPEESTGGSAEESRLPSVSDFLTFAYNHLKALNNAILIQKLDTFICTIQSTFSI